MKIAIIGAGRMGQALATGLIASKTISAKNIAMSDPDGQKLKALKKKMGISIARSNKETCKNAGLVILAVKPAYMAPVADEIKKSVRNRIVVSIAAGIRLKKIEGIITSGKIIRVMPNTPCLVCEGVIAYSLGKNISKKDENTFTSVFSGVGKCIKVSERHMNSITGLTGSGPAYVYLIASALMAAGQAHGLNERLGRKLVVQLMVGAAKMLENCRESPDELIAMVTSPKGTTIEGLKVLEKRKVRKAIVDAVAAAARRANELAEII